MFQSSNLSVENYGFVKFGGDGQKRMYPWDQLEGPYTWQTNSRSRLWAPHDLMDSQLVNLT